jgi:hypothetical protein
MKDKIFCVLSSLFILLVITSLMGLVINEHNRMKRLDATKYCISIPNQRAYFVNSYEVTSEGISFQEIERGERVEYRGGNFLIITRH